MKRFLRVHGKSPLHLGRGACVSARQGRDSYVSPGCDIISGRCDYISKTLNSSRRDRHICGVSGVYHSVLQGASGPRPGSV